jgi:transcriptional regulator with XRE-family HTH domain
MASVYEKVGKNIERMRKSKAMSQQDLAVKARIDLTTVSELESGLRNPSLKTLNTIASALDISLKKLFDF